MSKPSHSISARHGEVHGTFKSYASGFLLSLFLTFEAYLLVDNKLLEGGALVAAIIALALTQLLVQLVFFLHLGRESKPRLNVLVFLFMLMVLVILVFGSLWIMNNLNYHTMTPEDTKIFIEEEEAIQK